MRSGPAARWRASSCSPWPAAYTADAAGAWAVPWVFFFPVFFGGLWLAATVTWVSYRLRRRRDVRKASAENSAAPASSSGSQAMR